MIVFRLIQEKYSPDWDGKGAELIGRRWNSKGLPMIYTSESRALCTAEIAVHIALGSAPAGYIMLTINIPEHTELFEIDLKALTQGWKKFPFTEFTRKLGDDFILQNKFPLMKAPSAAIPGDFNYLINPRHPDFEKIKIIKIEPYEFDEMFFKR
jgi:RES domain-containing protein